MINLHYFLPRSSANGPGERSVVWVQGCPQACPGCFNSGTQAFVDRELVSVEELESRILAQEGIDGVTFSGGEPFFQAKDLARLAKRLKKRGLTVVCYTGYTLAQLQSGNRHECKDLLEQIDLLIDGPFVQDLRIFDIYRGSSNQQLHFLSGRIQPKDVAEPQKEEYFVGVNGDLVQTGFPTLISGDKAVQEAIHCLETA